MTVPTTLEPRTGRALIDATRPFAEESPRRSWWYLGTVLVTLVGALTIAALAPWWPARIAASVVGGLVMVRVFILYHDFMHGAVLARSRVARALLYAYGALLLVPPRSWRKSHNFHHAMVGKVEGSSVGSFWLMTTDMWRRASRRERLRYRVVRHPLTILLAGLTVFLFTVTLVPLLTNPRRHWDSAVALGVHGGVIAALWLLGGADVALTAFVLPYFLATALGAYLFYAQHTFVGMRILAPAEWTFVEAALVSCSYLKLGRVMSWFTGDIGYHHVHHLNPKIPFYRLTEATNALPELQRPVVTTLRPRDVLACLRLKLWDEASGRMVTYAEAERDAPPIRAAPPPHNEEVRPMSRSIKLAAVGLAAISLIVLIVQNTQVTQTKLLFVTVAMPQAVLLAVTLLIGIVIGLVIAARFRTAPPAPQPGSPPATASTSAAAPASAAR